MCISISLKMYIVEFCFFKIYGKRKLVRKIREFEKLGVRLKCLNEERE